MKRLDIIIIVLMITISIASLGIYKWYTNQVYGEKYLEISVKGELFKTLPLKEDSKEETLNINTDLGVNIVKISNGRVGIVDANCPDELCIKDGFISQPGEMLVCLPNKLVLEIKGQKQSETELDELSY